MSWATLEVLFRVTALLDVGLVGVAGVLTVELLPSRAGNGLPGVWAAVAGLLFCLYAGMACLLLRPIAHRDEPRTRTVLLAEGILCSVACVIGGVVWLCLLLFFVWFLATW